MANVDLSFTSNFSLPCFALALFFLQIPYKTFIHLSIQRSVDIIVPVFCFFYLIQNSYGTMA